MKVFVPYTALNPLTIICLAFYDHECIEMVDDDSYCGYFQQRWKDGESFINCEHDTVFWLGAIESLERCPEPWCAFDTQDFGAFKRGKMPPLALAKFSAPFIKKYPDVWDEMADTVSYPGVVQAGCAPSWMWCDAFLHGYMANEKVRCHQHFPPVLNDKETFV
jgi:hypothetical protein